MTCVYMLFGKGILCFNYVLFYAVKLRLLIREKLRNEILLRNSFRRSVYRNAKVQAKTSFAVCCRGSNISW